MEITLSWQNLITVSAVIGAIVAIYKYTANAVRWVDQQKRQTEEIEALKLEMAKKEEQMKELICSAQKKENNEIEQLRSEVNDELTLINYGLLACLKGLAEQGCDGPVHDAIDKIEKHLNQKAHK